jgi:hypothetical protein
MAAGHSFLASPLYILKAEEDHDPMDSCDDDPRKVWVVVTGWSYRRAVLTHAEPFLEVAGTTNVAALEGMTFMAVLDLMDPPPFEHEGGERLDWPELRLAPSMEEVYRHLGIAPPQET